MTGTTHGTTHGTARGITQAGGYSPAPARLLAIGLALAIVADVVVGWSLRYWPASVGVVGMSIVAVAWAFSAAQIRLPAETAIALLIGCWGPLQVLLHASVLPALTLRTSVIWMMCTVTFVISSQILRSTRNRETFLRLILWSATGLAVVAMLQEAFGFPVKVFLLFPADSEVVGTFYYKNHFAAFMELTAPIALWEVKNGKILPGGLCFAAMFAATITSLSRAGTIGILAEFLLFVALMAASRRWRLQTALAVTGLLVGLIAGASMVVGTAKIWNRMEEAHPYGLRAQLTRSTLEMAAERPWLGFGMGTWRHVYPRFARLDDGKIVNEAHNDLAQWAAEGGIPFFALMATLAVWISGRAFRSIWGLGLLVLLGHCAVDYALRNGPLQLLWFSLAGALCAVQASRSAPVREAPLALTSEH